MFKNMKSKALRDASLLTHPVCPVKEMAPRYTDEDWRYNNKVKLHITAEQERMAERIVENSRRVMDDLNYKNKVLQRDVEHNLRERANEIRFLCEELKKQQKTATLEEEALDTYHKRILNAIEFLKEKSLFVCQNCMVLREGRLGVDLCNDDVDRNLRLELKIIKGCQGLMNKALTDTTEQLRNLRATMYTLQTDLAQKDKSLLIDENNLRLHESRIENANLAFANDKCAYSLAEWEQQTYLNIERNAKELTSALQLRTYIDLMLKQVIEDMQNQTDRTNDALNQRIVELKHIKSCLEDKHNDTLKHIDELQKNIQALEKELADNDRAMQLCLTRLCNRATRPGLEMTCDEVQNALRTELEALKASKCQLHQKLLENKASLRYLLHVQIMQEEEINIKANSIKIDEVDCITMRQCLKYQSF